MYGSFLVLNDLKWGSIYSGCEKLAISSRYALNLSNSVDRYVQAVDHTKLAFTNQFWQV